MRDCTCFACSLLAPAVRGNQEDGTETLSKQLSYFEHEFECDWLLMDTVASNQLKNKRKKKKSYSRYVSLARIYKSMLKQISNLNLILDLYTSQRMCTLVQSGYWKLFHFVFHETFLLVFHLNLIWKTLLLFTSQKPAILTGGVFFLISTVFTHGYFIWAS